MRASKRWWDGPGGGREVLTLAYPLVLSHITITVQVFMDRLFLTWYSVEAVAGEREARFDRMTARWLEPGDL